MVSQKNFLWVSVLLVGVFGLGVLNPAFGVTCQRSSPGNPCPIEKMAVDDPDCCIQRILAGPSALSKVFTPKIQRMIPLVDYAIDHRIVADVPASVSSMGAHGGSLDPVWCNSTDFLKTTVLLL